MKVMLIDVSKCNGCFCCQLACKDEHVDNDWSPYARPQPELGHFWMKLSEVERGEYPKVKIAYVPEPCLHCQYAGCITQSPKGSVYRRPDGIVIIDPVKSQGHPEIVETCPYGRIYWNETLGIPQKCTFCAHLLDEGKLKEPRCVEACPTHAILFGDYEDLKNRIKADGVEVPRPELGLRPNVYYIGLPKRFVAGSVVFGDSDECAEGVVVTLAGSNNNKVTRTNNYGDFEFDGLPADGEFTVKLECPGYAARQLKVRTDKDTYLGDIVLKANKASRSRR